jgi:FMN reductase
MSGALKNFLDFHWEEFAGKLFGYVCASHEKGLTVMDHMRTAVRQCYGWSLPYGVSVHGEQDLDAAGAVTNPRLTTRLRMLARDLVVYGGLLAEQFRQDVRAKATDSFASRYAG